MNRFSELPVFEGLSAKTLEALFKKEHFRCYQKGEHLFRDHEKTALLFILLEGKAALYKITENGQKKVIFILGPGEFLNTDVDSILPNSISCEAFENAEVLCCEKDLIETLMQSDFKLTKKMMDASNRKIRRLYRQLKNATGVIKIEKRVAAKLWKLGNDYGLLEEKGCLVDVEMSVTYLADLMGSPRETISRALKFLTAAGLITQKNKKILIYDMKALAEFFKT
ncbi:MAG: Crp/Fnr family transcriptional regulator [Eubacterium sp.]